MILLLYYINDEGLQVGLQALHAYCVNTTKSKVIKYPPTMTYNDEPFEYVQSFKYLGLNFNSKCSFTESFVAIPNCDGLSL